jgi:hypothetical protein
MVWHLLAFVRRRSAVIVQLIERSSNDLPLLCGCADH